MIKSLRIQHSEIGPDGVDVHVDLPATWFVERFEQSEARLAAEDGAKATVSAKLSRSGRDIVVRGTVCACLHVPCVRCLSPASITVEASLSLLLETASRSRLVRGLEAPQKRGPQASREPEYVFSSAEADLDVYDGETVLLDGFVREAILLEVPNFVLCSESCPGIPLAPGSNVAGAMAGPFSAASSKDIDPRLAPLGAFIEKEDNGPFTAADLVAAAAARSQTLSGKAKLQSSSSRRAVKFGKQRAEKAPSDSPKTRAANKKDQR